MRILLALFVLLSLTATSTVSAQATRTWVSGVGDDANPCSRTAPCKTFAGAISKTAASGEINALDPGGFGAVTITKSITIDGGGFIAGVLVSGTNGIVINTPSASDVVVLRNLDMDGLGTGLSAVKLLNAGALRLEDIKAYGFGASSANTIDLSGSTNAAANVVLQNVVVSHCVTNSNGIAAGGTASGIQAVNVTLDHVDVSGCATGLVVGDKATILARGSEFSQNSVAGVSVTSSSAAAILTLDHSSVTQNLLGASSSGALAVLRLSDTSVLDNTTGLQAASGGAIISYTNNRLKGNGTDGAPTQNLYPR